MTNIYNVIHPQEGTTSNQHTFKGGKFMNSITNRDRHQIKMIANFDAEKL